MALSGNYNYNTGAGTSANPGNIKSANVVIGVDRRNLDLSVELDVKGQDWDESDGNIPTCWVYDTTSGDVLIGVITLTNLSSNWKRYKLNTNTGGGMIGFSEYDYKNYGNRTIEVRVDDENDSRVVYTQTVDVNLDPIDHFLTLENPPAFGDDSTPDFIWTLKDFRSPQKLIPVLTVGGTTANNVTVTFDDDTTTSIGSTGIVNINGMTFGSFQALTFNHSDASKMYWKDTKNYKITAPTMSAGDNTFSLDLNCTKRK